MAKLSLLVLTSASLMIKQYAEQYRKGDLDMTLTELEPDLSLPRIKTYDFIIGKLNYLHTYVGRGIMYLCKYLLLIPKIKLGIKI